VIGYAHDAYGAAVGASQTGQKAMTRTDTRPAIPQAYSGTVPRAIITRNRRRNRAARIARRANRTR
jgi:hypothetical protein